MSDYLEAFSEENHNLVSNISNIGKHMVKLRTEMLEAQAQYEAAKKAYEHYAGVIVPQEMFSAGVEYLALSDGTAITLKHQYYCQPNKNAADRKIMSDWLIAHGGAHLIKSKLTVSAEDKEALDNNGVSYVENVDINTNSLKSFLKDGIGVSSGQQKFTVDDIPSCIHFQEVTTAEINS